MRSVTEQKEHKVVSGKCHLEKYEETLRWYYSNGKHKFKQLISACHCSVLTSIDDKERFPPLLNMKIDSIMSIMFAKTSVKFISS